MLILARYPQQVILIGEIRVTVLTIVCRKHGRARVTLGIDAPSEMPILRAELPRYRHHERNDRGLMHPEMDHTCPQQSLSADEQ